ncbi:MAG: ATP-binding protein, partial [Wohlfahrtiimonas sp.]
MVKIDISNLLQTLIHSLQETHANYTIEANIEADLNIRGYQDQIYSVMCNLIDNAIKHNPKGIVITVTWKSVVKGAYFSVQDNGVGIASHHLNRLTERFYQVDSSHTHKKNSSGLGLAIVKHALRNHGDAQLRVESVLDQGSMFSFVIPREFISK